MTVKNPVPEKGAKTRVRQSPNRAKYDLQALKDVLDACLIGHVSFLYKGHPVSIPTAIARIDDHLYLHGSRSSRLFQVMAAGEPVSVSVCIVDGLVKARSAFHCSMNYRSAVVFGIPEAVRSDDKVDLLDQFTEKLIPGTSGQYRPHLAKEIKATELIRLPLTEASAKIRDGDPIDDDKDLDLPYWAGIIPIERSFGKPVAAKDLTSDSPAPVLGADE